MVQKSLIGRLRASGGYTITEVLTVLVIVGLLFSFAVPAATQAIQKAREGTLRTNLNIVRTALDEFNADRLVYPKDLEQLVEEGYLRNLPKDLIEHEPADWRIILDDQGGIMDIKSRSPSISINGERYADW